VPPLPCLRPYQARVNLIWMEKCDLANTARIFQSRLSKPPCSSSELRVHLISFHISLLPMALYLYTLSAKRNRASPEERVARCPFVRSIDQISKLVLTYNRNDSDAKCGNKLARVKSKGGGK
jgi:hypothetical protein